MKGIRFKLLIYTSVLMILLLLFNILLQSNILNRYYSNIQKDKLISYAQSIEEKLINPNEFQLEVNRISNMLNARISIYDKDGILVYQKYSHTMGMVGKTMNMEKNI